jgi:hypothetical protein
VEKLIVDSSYSVVVLWSVSVWAVSKKVGPSTFFINPHPSFADLLIYLSVSFTHVCIEC